MRALEGAALEVPAGSVHAILGENGAGKSTLAKIIAGIVMPDSGELQIDGVAYAAGSVRAAHARGVHCVFQEISLVPQWTVAQNLLLPDRALASRWAGRRMTKTAQALLDEYELDVDADALTSHLSLAQRQAVELVRNAISDPKVLILDEATSALTPPEVRWLFDITRRLVVAGTTVLYVSHRMAEVAELADHGTVMRDGAVVGSFTRHSFHADEVLTLMAGRPTSQVYPALAPHPAKSAQVLLDVQGLRTERLQGLSIQLRRGEVVGLGGLQGQGQAELLRALAGISPARAERWKIGTLRLRRLSSTKSVRLRQAYVPEDRKQSGLALDFSVASNLAAPWLKPFGPGGKLMEARRASWIREVAAVLRIRTKGAQQRAGDLSGGNQQKIVIGRWLLNGMEVYLLNDPTRGIDVSSKQEIYAVIQQLAREGAAVLWLSTEVEELVHGCHRVLVMYRGQVVSELAGSSINARSIVGSAIGHK